MAVQVRGFESADASFGTTFSIAKPAGVQAGDLLLLQVGYSNSERDAFPVGAWTRVRYMTGITESLPDGHQIWKKTAGASEPDSYVVEFSSYETCSIGVVALYSDGSYPLLVDASATLTTPIDSTDRLCPGVTTHYDDGMLLCFYELESATDSDWAPAAGMTEAWSREPLVGIYLMYEALGAAGPTGSRIASGFATADATVLAITIAVAEYIVVPEVPHRYGTQILVDQWAFASQSNLAELAMGNEAIEVTVVGHPGHQYTTIRGDGSLHHRGFFSGAGAGYLQEEMYSRLGADQTVHAALLLGTGDVGCPAYVLPNNQNRQLAIAAPAKSVITVEGTWSQGNGMKRGRRVFSGALSAPGAQAGVNFGRAGDDGGFAYLFVQGIVGSASGATLTIESHTDGTFSGAAIEGTFTFSAVGAYEIELSGIVNRHIRANLTSLGGATAISCYVIVCVRGVTF